MRRAVVLLSGGLDSATVLAMAQASGRACHTLTMEYGQRHLGEITMARMMAEKAEVESHREVRVDLGCIGGSALTDTRISVPTARSDEDMRGQGVPATYVPARNTIMLSVALALAESLQAREIWCGVNSVDYSGYPDCRPVFIRAFEDLAKVATKAGLDGRRIMVKAPLIRMSKAEIILAGLELGVDYASTASCYLLDADGLACGSCDACILRRRGFEEAGVPDPTRYRRASV